MNYSIDRLEDVNEKLYGKNDVNGEWIYYLDKDCKKHLMALFMECLNLA